LASPVNSTVLKSKGVGTITDDDSAPTISVNDVSVEEGNTGTVNMAFTLTLSGASGLPVTVKYFTGNFGTARATAGTDYVALPATTLTFAPGETSKVVNVAVNSDMVHESDETLGLFLSMAANATILDTMGTGTIFDDDPIAAATPVAVGSAQST